MNVLVDYRDSNRFFSIALYCSSILFVLIVNSGRGKGQLDCNQFKSIVRPSDLETVWEVFTPENFNYIVGNMLLGQCIAYQHQKAIDI